MEDAVESSTGADVGEEEQEVEPLVRGKVEVLTEENFERVTQVATGATTGDWFISECLWRSCMCIQLAFVTQ